MRLSVRWLSILIVLSGIGVALASGFLPIWEDPASVTAVFEKPVLELHRAGVTSVWGGEGESVPFGYPGLYRSFSLDLEFRAQDVRQYDNIFQTAGLNRGLRLELVPAENSEYLGFLIASENGAPDKFQTYPLGVRLAKDKLHSLRLWAETDGVLKVSLNGKDAVLGQLPGAFAVDEVKLGIGFDDQRSFSGSIRSFWLRLEKTGAEYRRLTTYGLGHWVLGILIAFTVILSIFLVGRLWHQNQLGHATYGEYFRSPSGMLCLALPASVIVLSSMAAATVDRVRSLTEVRGLGVGGASDPTALFLSVLGLVGFPLGVESVAIRLVTLLPLLVVCVLLTRTFVKSGHYAEAAIAPLLLVLIGQSPALTGDLESVVHFWPVFLFSLALLFLTSDRRPQSHAIAGLFFSLCVASLGLYSLAPLLLLFYWTSLVLRKVHQEQKRSGETIRDGVGFLIGMMAGLTPSFIHWSIQGTWISWWKVLFSLDGLLPGYFSAGINNTWSTVTANLAIGLTQYYGFLVLLGSATLFVRIESSTLRVIQLVLLPACFVNLLFFSASQSGLTLLIVFAFSVLAAFGLGAGANLLIKRVPPNPRSVIVVLLLTAGLALAPGQIIRALEHNPASLKTSLTVIRPASLVTLYPAVNPTVKERSQEPLLVH